MKRKSQFFVLFAVVLCLLTLNTSILAHATSTSPDITEQTSASKSVEQSAKNAVEAFFNAGIHNNFNEVVSNSIDKRSENTLSFRHKVFDKQVDNFLGYQIQSVQKVDSTNAIVVVNIRQTNLTATVEYPVVFDGEKWLVDITNTHAKAAVALDTASIKNNSQSIQRVAQYGGTVTYREDVYGPLMSGATTYSVTGWQVPTPSTDMSLPYQLVGQYWWGTWPISTKWVAGTYDTNDWFDALTWSNVSSDLDVFLYITSPGGDSNWYVGGNIYAS